MNLNDAEGRRHELQLGGIVCVNEANIVPDHMPNLRNRLRELTAIFTVNRIF